jgi:hypothetical protein
MAHRGRFVIARLLDFRSTEPRHVTRIFEQGFLGTRGSFMLDFVSLAMAMIVPLLATSVLLVKVRRRYGIHKWIQVALGSLLALAVAAFEIDLRFVTDWQKLAEPSPFYEPGRWDLVKTTLAVHLCFAVPTALLWILVLVRAWWRFPRPPAPNAHSRQHVLCAWPATIGMGMTALTGWLFYILAFVA